MRIECKNCGGDHPVWDCKRPAKKSQDSSMVERRMRGKGNSSSPSNDSDFASHEGVAERIGSGMMRKSEVALVGSTPAPGAKFDKVAYQREYMRKRRTKARETK